MTAFLVIVGALAVVVLVLIIVAPWKAVRAEPKLDKSDEAKLLLHRDPDEPTGEYHRISPVPDGPDDETDPDATYADLAKLDDEPDE
ncbi:MAG: hypothetical protein U0W40_16245 [Acidimicrobiia bacterium]